MGKPILYGVNRSSAVRTVLMTASAIGLDLELKEVDITANQHKSSEFLSKNPQHTIPTLEDGASCIWDSHAIVTYLIGRYAENDELYPEDLYTRAIIHQRFHFDSGVLSPAFKALRIAQNQRCFEKMQHSRKLLLQSYEFLETFLGSNLYMVGDALTIADFSIVTTVSSANCFLPIDPSQFPKLNQWLIRMAELPYYQEANGSGLQSLIAFVQGLESSVWQ